MQGGTRESCQDRKQASGRQLQGALSPSPLNPQPSTLNPHPSPLTSHLSPLTSHPHPSPLTPHPLLSPLTLRATRRSSPPSASPSQTFPPRKARRDLPQKARRGLPKKGKGRAATPLAPLPPCTPGPVPGGRAHAHPRTCMRICTCPCGPNKRSGERAINEASACTPAGAGVTACGAERQCERRVQCLAAQGEGACVYVCLSA